MQRSSQADKIMAFIFVPPNGNAVEQMHVVERRLCRWYLSCEYSAVHFEILKYITFIKVWQESENVLVKYKNCPSPLGHEDNPDSSDPVSFYNLFDPVNHVTVKIDLPN